MQRIAMIPLITFDLLVNVYLTILFLLPLRALYGFRHIQRNPANERLRTVAFRTFIGSVATTVSSIANLSVLMALDGEPGWVCLMCCNLDIAFSAMVVHWVTSKDKTAVFQPSATSAYAKGVVSMYQLESEAGNAGAGAGPSSSAGGHPPRNIGGSSSNNINSNKILFGRGGCVHECKPGTGCYGRAANKDTAAVTIAGSSNTRTTTVAAAVLQHPSTAPSHKSVPSITSHGQGLGVLNYASVVVDKDGQPINKAFMTPEAIAMYHYNHHRYMNGGSSNRYPFTKSSSVTGGTLENTRSDTSSRYSEFRKYTGGRLFADNIDPLEPDEGEEREHSSDEDCEYELVLRKKMKRSRTPPILPAELDPVVSNSRPGSRKWSVAAETTLVVESTAAVDEAGITPQLKSSSGAVFGTRTVCLGGGGGGEEHHEDGECSPTCRQHAFAAAAGSTSAAAVGAVVGATSRLKRAGKRHSRNISGVASEDSEMTAVGGSSSVRAAGGGKKEVSWLDVHDTRTSADFEQEGNDFMWDGTQGDRSTRVEPDVELARYDSQESILQLRLEEI